MSILSAMREYQGRSVDADRLMAPPVDALPIIKREDRRLNRQLAIFFTGLLEQSSTTAQIRFLHDTAEAQEKLLIATEIRIDAKELDPIVSTETWGRMIRTLRSWAEQISEGAAEEVEA
jgi:hypothetical protein